MTALGRMKARIVTVCALAFFASAFLESSAHATFPGKNGRILFFDRGGAEALNVHSGKAQRVGGDIRGKIGGWSPGGRSFAYSGSGPNGPDIFVRTQDGETTRITDSAKHEFAFDPSFSGPDGRRIAYFRFMRPARGEIWIMRADGSGQRRLVGSKDTAVTESEPSFSPDGRSVVFARHGKGYVQRAFITRANGSHTHGILRSVRGDIEMPSFSPDGKQLVFVVTHKVNGRFVDQVGIKSLQGGRVHYLTGPRRPPRVYAAVFSPDGKRVAYSAYRAGQNRDVIFSVSVHRDHRRQIYRSKRRGESELDSSLSWANR